VTSDAGARLLGLSFALALAGCRSCTFHEGRDSYEHLDAPVKVTLVRDARPMTGLAAALGSVTWFALHVATAAPFDERVACTAVDLAEDAAGATIAFRCREDGARWRGIRLGKHGEHLLDCASDLGGGDAPDFHALPAIDAVAPAIVACHEADRRSVDDLEATYAALESLVRERAGAPGVRALLGGLADRAIPPFAWSGAEEPWMIALRLLPREERAAVAADLCPALVDATKGEAYARAARLCPVDAPGVVTAALARMRDGLAKPPESWGRGFAWPVQWAIPIAVRGDAAAAGRVACTAASAARPGDFAMSYAELALAATHTNCPAIIALPLPCDDGLDCGDALCTPKDAAASLAAWTALAMDGEARPRRPVEPDPARAHLLALYELGELPPEVVTRNARRHYAMPREGAPPCDGALAAGAPCTCKGLGPRAPWLCEAPLDGGVLVRDACAVRVDDRRRVVLPPTRACGAATDGGACPP
jgi:hypothetical protein